MVKKFELMVDGLNWVWLWDIMCFGGVVKWNWFYLYVIIDIFSCYVLGWMLVIVENHINVKALLVDMIGK